MTILEALWQSWSESVELISLVPSHSVIIGPVNPGMPVPAIGFLRQQQKDGLHTSTSRFVSVSVTAVAQAEDPGTLEEIAEAIREHLTAWQSTRFKAFGPIGVSATIEREERGPSTLWRAEFTIDYQAERLD